MLLRKTAFAAAGFCAASIFASVGHAQSLSLQPDPASWQAAITGQIVALRNEDGAGALAVAASGFRQASPNPAQFMTWIERAGYGPIVDSERHSFGDFFIDPDGTVLQQVTVVAWNLEIYTATYQLAAEDGVWRVYGVSLRPENALAI